jgi:hypothetical protein
MLPFKVAGKRIRPGQSRTIDVSLTESYFGTKLSLPVTIVRAERPGPVVLVTAAVHGDELNGIEMVRGLVEQISPSDLRRGALILAPVLAVPAFLLGSRYLPDRRDLNRHFPGSRHGSMASRIASRIFRTLVLKSDYLIDLHTASKERTNLPHVRGDLRDARVRRIARAFGSEVVVHKRASKRTLRGAATRAGVAAILYEAGQANCFQREMVVRGLAGLRNVLRSLRMLAGKVTRPAYRVIVKRAVWARARRGGILDIRVRPGDLVYRGDPLAITTSPFGHERDVIAAPSTGLVLGVHTLPLANPGNAICHIVRLTKTLKKVERIRGSALPAPVFASAASEPGPMAAVAAAVELEADLAFETVAVEAPDPANDEAAAAARETAAAGAGPEGNGAEREPGGAVAGEGDARAAAAPEGEGPSEAASPRPTSRPSAT